MSGRLFLVGESFSDEATLEHVLGLATASGGKKQAALVTRGRECHSVAGNGPHR
jgi:hypothetical protein